MLVSFLVVTRNAEKTLGKCLGSIKKQKVEKEIVLADSYSEDRTREIAKRFGARVFLNKNRKITGARNICLREARGRFLAFVDSDVVLPKGWINRALDVLGKGEDVAGVGGTGIDKEGGLVSKSIGALLYGNPKKRSERKYVNSLATMDLVYDREKIKGLEFDDRLTGAEDAEFNFRVRKKGFKLLFDNSLWVYHYHRSSMGSLLKRWYEYGRVYPNPYMIHKEMRSKGFYMRLFYLPVLVVLLVLSGISQAFFWLAVLQVLGLFGAYLYLGVRSCSGRLLLVFPFVHFTKQFAQFLGIFVWLFRRRW
jgi:glycosyltransferase involved in cell wall biosynthesis